MSLFPPSGPTTPTSVLPAYAYQEYSDDDDIQALIGSYNIIAQQYLNWFNTINLPIYTGLIAPLLDWVAQGLYGISRPTLVYGGISSIGPVNTWTPNQIGVNAYQTIGTINQFTVSDDIFKRIITWFFFKGDGQQFCVTWLKRRIMRFLTCPNGTALNIDNTYPIGIRFNGGGRVAVTIEVDGTIVTFQMAQIFQAAVSSNAIALPFQLSFSVELITPGFGLNNDGGVLQVTNTTGWPTSPVSLSAGDLWSNGGAVSVIPGYSVSGSPIVFGSVTSQQLLTIGGTSMPVSNPGIGTGLLWNNGGEVNVA